MQMNLDWQHIELKNLKNQLATQINFEIIKLHNNQYVKTNFENWLV
jgi:hypothetical protein